nr:uncharacterized protein LOC111510111 [Leptinotarsa decemlineata]
MAVIGIPKYTPLFSMFCIQVRFFLAYLNGNFKVNKEEMMEDVQKYLNDCKQSGKPPHMELKEQFKKYFDDLAKTANIKEIQPAILKMHEFYMNEGVGKFDLVYRIINDEEFEQFPYNNNYCSDNVN